MAKAKGKDLTLEVRMDAVSPPEMSQAVVSVTRRDDCATLMVMAGAEEPEFATYIHDRRQLRRIAKAILKALDG